jgi:AAHS family 4-hydroxybenzoate transporter-like MFS transporter
MIERLGWQSVFVLGGIVPCVLFVVMTVALPESIRYLVLRRDRDAQVALILAKIDPRRGPAPTEPPRFAVEEHASGAFPVRQLFADGRTLMTLALWVVFFMSLLDLYFVTNWMPTLMHDAGATLDRAVMTTAMFQFGGTAGTLVLGRVFDRFPPFRILAGIYLVASLTLVLIATAGTSVAFLTAAVFAAGFCIVGGQIGANALTAGSYPTAIRATGVGWALGVGRIGSIAGPAFGGLLLSVGWGAKPIFMLAAAPPLLAAAVALSIDLAGRRARR